ncbi:hypothetical protein HYFRA_00007918 [Hymenoscyphus fraxineus]|uniref:Cryptochrome DASH n=1 Tax=Hymenoscyphus fraxineus TaxID=746836 RepID=A0A9N9PR63_9HELO|nr:hypothetical protein HYFRA_00007918 [Hymenoscyphus fraxineus]
MAPKNVLIYLLRRDLRLSDNPIFHSLSKNKDHGFTHVLPLYVFAAQQLEVKGFIPDDENLKSPYPEARSQVGGFWRTGPHRAKFLAETVSDLKETLEGVGSGLCIRVGMLSEVVEELITGFQKNEDTKVGAVWLTSEEGVEEKRDERATKKVCEERDIEFKVWLDEKYLKDDRDLPFSNPQDAPDVFTAYRMTVEPLRDALRDVLPTSAKGTLPDFPADAEIPAQHSPFRIPDTAEGLMDALMKPLAAPLIPTPPECPKEYPNSHPLSGGETHALARLEHLITTGAINTYKETRNGLMGTEFSTKLSAYLVLGSITSRQIHASLVEFEDGTAKDGKWKDVEGYGKGENAGTKSIRFELLWRDYMRLCNVKFGYKLFRIGGFRDSADRWVSPQKPGNGQTKEYIKEMVERFLSGTTGMGLIDASQRELYYTGYTSNRARQNTASFLAKHLWIDWRIGAEWYESMLVDYDVSSNWGNWQYLSGVGNDPRGEARIFNPVKQAFDYDPNATYVKTWVPELRGLTDPGEIFQPWTIRDEKKKAELGLTGLPSVEKPLKKIEFTVGKRGRHLGRINRGGNDGNQRSTETGGGRGGGQSRGGYGGRGYGGRGYGGGSRGHYRGFGRGRGEGRELRTGNMDKDRAAADSSAPDGVVE